VNIEGIQDTSFINSVLQILGLLSNIKLWIQNLSSNQNQIKSSSTVTKELCKLLTSLYNNQQPDSTSIILHYNNYLKIYYKKQITQDPCEFMYYLLDILNLENNNPSNPNLNEDIINNQDLQSRKNLANMYNIYTNYFQQAFNSIVSQNFSNILKYEMKCPNCSSYFNYNYKNILEFDVDEYRKNRDQAFPHKNCMNLNMDECFTNFVGGYPNQCIYCNNIGTVYTKISNKNKILIISFKRNNHTGNCDIDFENSLNIAKYCAIENMN
jgi:hypothetical protein